MVIFSLSATTKWFLISYLYYTQIIVKSQIILLNRLEDVEKLSCDISYTSSEYSLKNLKGWNIYKKW